MKKTHKRLSGDDSCYWCGKRVFSSKVVPRKHHTLATVDHVIPRAVGGETSNRNIVIACYSCNTFRNIFTNRHDKEPSEDARRKLRHIGWRAKAFLQFDHKSNNGALHRQVIKTSFQLLQSLKRLGWPKDHIQLLCANCNFGKLLNGGVCPHVKNPS